MRNRVLVTALSVTAVTAGLLVSGAAPASARRDPILISPATPNQVWVQSFQRPSADAPCIAPASLDIALQEGWNPADLAWTPTWEQWPNNGQGGWTCTRSITWALGHGAVYSGGGIH